MYYLAKDKDDELLQLGFEEYSDEYEWEACWKNADGDDLGGVGLTINRKTREVNTFSYGVGTQNIDIAEKKIKELYNKGVVCLKVNYLEKIEEPEI